MQFSKNAVFRAGRQSSPLQAPRVSLGAFRPQPVAHAGYKEDQMTDLANAGLAFAASEINAGVRSKRIKTSSDVELAWETAYQKAKGEQESPENWTVAADAAANKVIESSVEDGNVLTNLLYKNDTIKAELKSSLVKLKASKAADVQKGRMELRLRHYADATIKSAEKMKTILGSVTLRRDGEESYVGGALIKEARASALKAYTDFSKTIDSDKLIPSKQRRTLKTNFVSSIGNTLVSHIIRTDPENAIRYMEYIDGIADNNAYKGVINSAGVAEQKKRLKTAYEFVGNISKLVQGEEAAEDMTAVGTKINDLNSALEAGDTPKALTSLKYINEIVPELLEKKYVDPRGDEQLLYKGEDANRLIKMRDEANLAVLEPLYTDIAADLLVLSNNENAVDQKTLTDAVEYLNKLRQEDPGGFFKIAENLSSRQREIFEAKLRAFTTKEKIGANAAQLAQKQTDLVASTKTAVRDFTTDLRGRLIDWNKLSPENHAKALQRFFDTHWKPLTTAFANGARNIISPDEAQNHIMGFKKTVINGIGKGVKEEGRTDWYEHIKENKSDYPFLFELFVQTSLGADISSDREKSTAEAEAQAERDLFASGQTRTDKIGTKLRTVMTDWKDLPSEEFAEKLRGFIKTNWDSFTSKFTADSAGIISPKEVEREIVRLRQSISKATGDSLVAMNRVDFYNHVHNRARDYPVLFEILAKSGLDNKLGQQRKNQVSALRKGLITAIKGGTNLALRAVSGENVQLPSDLLDNLGNQLRELCKIDGCSEDTIRAIGVNLDFLGRHYQHNVRVNDSIQSALQTGTGGDGKLLTIIEGQIKNLSELSKTFESSGPAITMVDNDGEITGVIKPLPTNIAAAMLGDDASGTLAGKFADAFKKNHDALVVVRDAIDPAAFLDPKPPNIVAIGKAIGLHVQDENSQTPIDRFMHNPNSDESKGIVKAIGRYPTLALPFAEQLRQRFNMAYPTESAAAEALVKLSGIVYDAWYKMLTKTNTEAGHKLPEALLDIVGAYESIARSSKVGSKDFDGQFVIAQKYLHTPKNLNDKPEVGTWMAPGVVPREEQMEAVRAGLGLTRRLNNWRNIQTVDDSANVELQFVLRQLGKMQADVSPVHDDYLKKLEETARQISIQAQEDGILGDTIVGVGLEGRYLTQPFFTGEIAETSWITEHPMEATLVSKIGLNGAAAYGHIAVPSIKQIATTSALLISVFEAAAKRGVPLAQVRANVTMPDINALFDREDHGVKKDFPIVLGAGTPLAPEVKRPDLLRAGQIAVTGPVTINVSAAQQKLVQTIEELAQKYYGAGLQGESFFLRKYSQEAVRAGSYGILSNKERPAWSKIMLPEGWQAGSSSILSMPQRAQGTVGPAMKITGSDGVPRTAYNIIVGLKSARSLVEGLDETFGITESAPQTTVTLRQYTLPALGDDSAAGRFLNWYNEDLRAARGSYKAPERSGEISDPGGA